MHVVFGLILAAHGFVHLAGFVVPWRIAHFADMPYGTTVLGGRVDLGHAGIRAVGLLWLLAAAGYFAAAVAVGMLAPGWWTLAFGITLASTILCTLGLPHARVGLGVDLILIALLLVDRVTDWIPTGT